MVDRDDKRKSEPQEFVVLDDDEKRYFKTSRFQDSMIHEYNGQTLTILPTASVVVPYIDTIIPWSKESLKSTIDNNRQNLSHIKQN